MMVHWRHFDTELLSYNERKTGIIWWKRLAVNSPQMATLSLTFLNILPSFPSPSLELGIYRIMLMFTHSRAFKVKRNRQ